MCSAVGLITHPITIDRTMDFRTMWRFVACPPLVILLFYLTPQLVVGYFLTLYFFAFHYTYTFALLYLIAGPPEPNPSPRSTAVWKFVVVWALLVYLKFCEGNILDKLDIFTLYWFVFHHVFDYDVVFLRKMEQHGRYMFEKCMDELVELLTLFSFPPRLGTRLDGGWELVADCRSSTCGFNVQRFCRVTVFDTHVPIDDPFYPDHWSTLHMVEVPIRNSVWYTIVIWRMSLINNGQWKVHEFDFVYDMEKEQELLDLFASGLRCFESNGVVFACLLDYICIYDTRLDVGMDCDLTELGHAGSKMMVSCVERIWERKDVLGGWKVRVIDGYVDEYEDQWRLCMLNRVFEMRLDSEDEVISEEEASVSGYFGPVWDAA